MMNRISIQTILTVALLFGTASQASADLWGHIDRQANDIERATKKLRTEVDHYRHTRYYGKLIGATARLKGQAIATHSIAEHSHSIKALKNAVAELGRAFNDAEYLFDEAERNAAYGDGRIGGNTAHVKQHLNSIGACIANLQADLLKLTQPVTVVRKPVVKPAKVYRQTPTINRGYDSYRGYNTHRGHDSYRSQGQSYSNRSRINQHQPVYRTGNRGGGVSLSIGGRNGGGFTINF